MAEKIMKTRVVQKHDTEENWNKATNFIPKQGEIIVYDVDSTYAYERLKIGDGVTNVNSLPFSFDDGKFIPRILNAEYNFKCYCEQGKTSGSVTTLVGVTTGSFPGMIMKRDDNGSAKVKMPTSNISTEDIANRGYVDTADSALQTSISSLYDLAGQIAVGGTTVKDTYSTRTTAGGLSVINNSPTVVHKIEGNSRFSRNIMPLYYNNEESGDMNIDGLDVTHTNNTYTFNGTWGGSGYDGSSALLCFTIPSKFYGQTIYYSVKVISDTSEYQGSSLPLCGIMVRAIDKNSGDTMYEWRYAEAIPENNFSDCQSIALDGKDSDGNDVFDWENYLYEVCITDIVVGDTYDNLQVQFMVGLGSEALPYEDYYAGAKNAAFKGVTSIGHNLLNQQNVLDTGRFKYLQESDLIKRISTAGGNGESVLEVALIPGTYTACVEFIGNAPTSQMSLNAFSNGTNLGTIVNSSSIVTNTIYSVSFTSTYPDIQIKHWGAYSDYSFRIWIVRGNSAVPYEKYITDTSFQLADAIGLRKWDYIDVDTQTLVTATADADFSSVTDAGGAGAGGADGTTTTGRHYWALCDEGMVAEDFTLSDIITDLQTIEDYQSVAPDENAYLSLDTATRTLILLIPASYGENGGTWVSEQSDIYALYKTSAPNTATATISCPKTYKVWRDGTETLDTSDTEAVLPTITQTYYEELA